MCGIFLHVYPKHCPSQLPYIKIKELISKRGPDAFSEYKIALTHYWEGVFFASTLWTQGEEIRMQPMIGENGDVFLWNGDVYKDEGTMVIAGAISDSDSVFSQIQEQGVNSLLNIQGPYSFIYFNANEKQIWFGRDIIGRHSLLWDVRCKELVVTSVCTKEVALAEVPCSGFYMADLAEPSLSLNLCPWTHLKLCKDAELEYNINITIKNELHHSVLSSLLDCTCDSLPSQLDYERLSVFSNSTSIDSLFNTLLQDSYIYGLVKILKDLLFKSVKQRTSTQPNYCKNCIAKLSVCKHSRTAVCFSGGLDSTILALIADQFVPNEEPIDLYNVAFERPNSAYQNFEVPDRISGQKSFCELQKLLPKRTFNFVEIDVTQSELNEMRKIHISDLIHPLKSILDDSLGCAVWFAARGEGSLRDKNYTSPSRILLLGMGADELFGGYSSQRKEFAVSGWPGLSQLLNQQIRNIGMRNLGRDNRMVADHGRQPRFPFLSEEIYAFVNSLPPWYRCYPKSNFPAGVGDKFLLRLLAWDLGLRYSATCPKKALQFGSRIAVSKEKGHEISTRLN